MARTSIFVFTTAAILLFSSQNYAQVRQTHLYIDDGDGNFEILSASHNGGTIKFPPGDAGILLTTASGGTIGGGAIWNGAVIGPTFGGTGLNSYATGDMIYASAANTLTQLNGNTTNTKEYLTSTGSGGLATAPVWGTIAASDLPAFAEGNNHTSGTVPDPGPTPGTSRFLREDGSWTVISSQANGVSFSSSSATNPATQAGVNAVCSGAGGSITPAKSGNFLIIVSGGLEQATNGNNTATVQPFVGAGTDPGNSTNFTAYKTGASVTYAATGNYLPFTQSAVITGLTLGTAYYVDVSYLSSNGGHLVTASNIVVSAIEF